MGNPAGFHAKVEATEWLVTAIANARYSIIAVQVLQIYEWFSNIAEEYRLVSKSAWTSVKITYLLCRYYPLLFWPIMEWAFVGNHEPEYCQYILRPVHGLFGLLSLPACAVLFLRAYAFSGRDPAVFVILSLSFTFVVGTHVWMFLVDIPLFSMDASHRVQLAQGGMGCFPDYRVHVLGNRVWVAMLSLFLMNLLSLIVVVYYCLRCQTRRTSLGRYFLRQGLNSFTYTSAVTLIALAFYFKAPEGQNAIGLPVIFALPDLLACRLILDLRRRALPTDSQISRMNSRIVRHAFETLPWRGNADVWIIDN